MCFFLEYSAPLAALCQPKLASPPSVLLREMHLSSVSPTSYERALNFQGSQTVGRICAVPSTAPHKWRKSFSPSATARCKTR